MTDPLVDLWLLNASLPDAPAQEPRPPAPGSTFDPIWQVWADGTTAEAAYRADRSNS